MRFLIHQESRQGSRKSNQDRIAYSYSRESLIMAVADGMGGHLHGEIAAHIAVKFLIEAFQSQARPRLEDPLRFLLDSITNAHLAILGYAEGRNMPETPRTTFVACVIQGGVAFWAHVGDSRLYLIRDGQVHAVTKDHSRVQQLVDIGRVREEAVANHPDRNKVYNCLGQSHLPRIETSRRTPLRRGDTILLCTDGLWGPLSTRTIVEAVLKDEVLKAMPAMMNTAEARAGSDGDNLSAIGLAWLGEEALDPEVPRSISTKTMQMSDVATQTAGFGKDGAADFLSDDEIERAIREIRGAISDAGTSGKL